MFEPKVPPEEQYARFSEAIAGRLVKCVQEKTKLTVAPSSRFLFIIMYIIRTILLIHSG